MNSITTSTQENNLVWEAPVLYTEEWINTLGGATEDVENEDSYA